ncbi:TPA: helix-turn-helix transcriptional regulator [Serratia rubidaea]|nr:helix-turn-helix transcriptional regulator [Serratia rubidaea]HDJ1447682.1 helix-turn-helix transcriptional regulator [Serratia rubidaea]HDJ1460739.1 helix-turn-helix transcriptional regulator [Serratia rubidaea]HDJ2771085.1 helix-turn-helix transcriptional regulator [Serratia rubidaea]
MILHGIPLSHPNRHLTPWHQHDDGQIYLLTHGAIALETEQRQWAMTAGTLGWLPPRCRHQAQSCGQVEGWLLFLSPATCRPLPGNARLLAASGLAQALVARIAGLPPSPLRAPQRRMVQVLLDEMQGEEETALQLPMPQDARLLKIARALLDDPASTRRQSEWAGWAGISVRSLSRLFMAQTGIGFARWRQQARIIRSLEALSRGTSVASVAADCGYDNVSAYIAAFRRHFGVTPGGYFAAPPA